MSACGKAFHLISRAVRFTRHSSRKLHNPSGFAPCTLAVVVDSFSARGNYSLGGLPGVAFEYIIIHYSSSCEAARITHSIFNRVAKQLPRRLHHARKRHFSVMSSSPSEISSPVLTSGLTSTATSSGAASYIRLNAGLSSSVKAWVLSNIASVIGVS